MAEQGVGVRVARLEDGDHELTIMMNVYAFTDLSRFIPYVIDELRDLAHDTYKLNWNQRDG